MCFVIWFYFPTWIHLREHQVKSSQVWYKEEQFEQILGGRRKWSSSLPAWNFLCSYNLKTAVSSGIATPSAGWVSASRIMLHIVSIKSECWHEMSFPPPHPPPPNSLTPRPAFTRVFIERAVKEKRDRSISDSDIPNGKASFWKRLEAPISSLGAFLFVREKWMVRIPFLAWFWKAVHFNRYLCFSYSLVGTGV